MFTRSPERRGLTSPLAVLRRTGPSTSSKSDLTIHGSLQPGLEGVVNQPRHQPPQRDVLLLGDSAEVVQEVVRQSHPDLRIGAPRAPPRRTGVAEVVRCVVMSVVHSLSLRQRDFQEEIRTTAQAEIPAPRYALSRSSSALTKPNHRANRTCR